jgi:indole-3-glycerol phosphate synthase
MPSLLSQILSNTLQELELRKKTLPLDEIRQMAQDQPPALDFASAIKGNTTKLIAEIKKASPSRGIIRHDFDPISIATIYANNGAAAISVVTENKYFGGNLNTLRDIKQSLARPLPVLRKDFIVDPYQIYEARVNGADSILLIAGILSPLQLAELIGLSHQMGMDCLVEVHNENEVELATKSSARIIGINNRDLLTFQTDLSTTERLRPLIPSDRLVVSESGIKTRADIQRLKRLGINAVLVGETLMSAPDIPAKIKELFDL